MSNRESSGPSNGCHCMEKHSSFDNLPKEIMVEIMFRLPPESLIRLKSLNKSWYFVIRCLIKDPDFMAKHLRHAEEHPVMFLVNECRSLVETPSETKTGLSKSKLRTQRSWSTLITRLIDKGNIHCVTENIDVPHLPSSLTAESRDCVEVYHCNGIILHTKGCSRIFTLYSPVMGKLETFHPKSIGGDHQICGMGFGSDSGGNNFKVVRILDSMRAHIFTPGTSESWRQIEISVLDRSFCFVYGHVYLNGYCFWMAWGRFKTVLCFDVCNEAFREILLPNELDAFRGNLRLATLDDSVCLLSCPYKKPIDVWVMDINSFSWRKWLRIEHFEEFLYPFAFWSSNELLMKAENGEMVSYNIQTQKLRSVSPKVMLGDIFYLGFYIKSLASAKWVL